MNKLGLPLAVLLASTLTTAASAEENFACPQLRRGLAERQKDYELAVKQKQWDRAAERLKAVGRLSAELKKFNCKS